MELDDYFPCFSYNGPCFSRSNGNELWVLLLEKAYAKVNNGYYNIEAGITGQAIRDLTGAPYEKLDLKNPEEVFARMKEADSKGYILTAGSQSSEEGIEKDLGKGIVSSHAYSVLDV